MRPGIKLIRLTDAEMEERRRFIAELEEDERQARVLLRLPLTDRDPGDETSHED